MSERRCSFIGCGTILNSRNLGPACHLHESKQSESLPKFAAAKVAVRLAEDGVAEGEFVWWDDESHLADLRADGYEVVEVELPREDAEAIARIADLLQEKVEQNDLSCGDDSLLSVMIPSLIAKAMWGLGYRK